VLDNVAVLTGAAPTHARDELRFPSGFRWGVATAAYQIEGSTNEDGRGRSIWDTFACTPGRVYFGQIGDIACDFYRRDRHDVALMREFNVSTYRFLVAWPRVVPDGSGPTNGRGPDFYDRLVDTLLESGINPLAMLYHWDLPQALEDRGGWTSRQTANHFADYARVVHARLGDCVRRWTLNEPWCSAFLGYANGEHAPGRADAGAAFAAVHHPLLGHGLAVEAMRAAEVREVSITLNLCPVRHRNPEADHDLDAVSLIDRLQNRIVLEPVLRSAHPHDILPVIDRSAHYIISDIISDQAMPRSSRPLSTCWRELLHAQSGRRPGRGAGVAGVPGQRERDLPRPGVLDDRDGVADRRERPL
jgi:beta-glucosidase